MKKIFEAIGNLFRTLFGGKVKEPSTPTPSGPRPKPVVINPQDPQDGADVKPDTVIQIVSEMDKVVVPPNEPEEPFVKDIFEETPPQPQTPTPTPTSTPTPTPTPAPTPTPTPTPTPAPAPAPAIGHKPRYMWCLDNGHGKQTPGKRSPLFDDGRTRFFEYEFNRDIVRLIKEALDKKGIKYFITVPEVDIDDFLRGRVDRANNLQSDLPKLFVSVHSNAAPAPTSESWALARGIETWFFHGSKRSQKMAGVFQKHLIEKTGWRNRQIKSQPQGQFFVLRNTTMPSVLTENGFYNNKEEAAELMKPEVRQQIADAHVAAIMEIERDGL